jgi:hypothetical protein
MPITLVAISASAFGRFTALEQVKRAAMFGKSSNTARRMAALTTVNPNATAPIASLPKLTAVRENSEASRHGESDLSPSGPSRDRQGTPILEEPSHEI